MKVGDEIFSVPLLVRRRRRYPSYEVIRKLSHKGIGHGRSSRRWDHDQRTSNGDRELTKKRTMGSASD